MKSENWIVILLNTVLGFGACFLIATILGLLLSGKGSVLLILFGLTFLWAINTNKNKNALDLVIRQWPIDPNAEPEENPGRAPEIALLVGVVVALSIETFQFLAGEIS